MDKINLRKGLWAAAGTLAFLAFITVSAGSNGFLQPAQVSSLEDQPAAELQANQGPELNLSPATLLDEPSPIRMPGLVVATGTYFEVKDSIYRDVTLQSSEEIKACLESVPNAITLSIKATGSADSTDLTLKGLEPNKTYYKYQGSSSNETVFVSDKEGSYTFKQDLSHPHLIWIQEKREPVFLSDEASKPGTSSVSALNQGLIQSMEATTIYVPDDYPTIQQAVTAASPGDAIVVRAGTYTENVNINKANLTLKSESGPEQTVVQAAVADHVFQIIADYATIDGFTIKGGTSGIYFSTPNPYYVAGSAVISNNKITENSQGIASDHAFWCNPMYGWPCYSAGSNHNLIADNILAANDLGIFLGYGDYHIIRNNTITGNNTGTGISFWWSGYNELTNNTITNFYQGIYLGFSWQNQFTHNTISDNMRGLFAGMATGNTFTGNTISNNSQYGLRLEYASATIYHNNFINNGSQVTGYIYFINSWLSLNEEYPTGGNYWSGHQAPDLFSGPNQDQPGQDGIADTPYGVLGEVCTIDCFYITVYDHYPFLQESGWEVPPSRILPDKAVELAKEVVGAPYLGDGQTWGGKGSDCSVWPQKRFVSPQEIKTESYYYYDTRFIHPEDCRAGRGLDCSGLSFWAYNRAYFGDELLSMKEYENRPLYYEGATRQFKDNTDGVEKENLKFGDLLFFDENNNGFMDHVAMYTGGDNLSNVIHASFFTKTITYATYDQDAEELITVKPTGEPQRRKVVAYGRVTEPRVALRITAYSPVDLIVADPDGFVTSIENSWEGPMEYQIYDINSDGDLDSIIVTGERKIGDYLITVVPKPNALPVDTYTLKVEALINDETIVVSLAESSPISGIPRTPYILKSTDTEITPIIPAFVDFDPDTLNLKSKGKYVAVYIELPIGYDINEADLGTIKLNGQIPAQEKLTEIGDYDRNGAPDLMVKFDRSAVQSILEVGNRVKITISGQLSSGELFEGSDIIRVISLGN